MDDFAPVSYLQDAFLAELLCSTLGSSIERCKQEIHRAAPPDEKHLRIRLQRLRHRLSAACALRDQIYAADILPHHCRNIYAAYYLYSRLCSGQETDLEEAIRNMNLDETRRQLDRILLRDGKTLLSRRFRAARREENSGDMSAVRRLVTNFLLTADYLDEN